VEIRVEEIVHHVKKEIEMRIMTEIEKTCFVELTKWLVTTWNKIRRYLR
jgi:hypothetical protein